MSSFLDHALRAIAKHPEIFSALEEYERTKKLPKYTYRKRVDITIDENILKKFREHCREKGHTMSTVVERYMRRELENR